MLPRSAGSRGFFPWSRGKRGEKNGDDPSLPEQPGRPAIPRPGARTVGSRCDREESGTG